MVQKCVRILILIMVISGYLTIFPIYADGGQPDQENIKLLSFSVKTDRGYYAPGEMIRIKGTVTSQEGNPVNASLLFSFQGMNKTASSGSGGSFLVTIPVSSVQPENLYKLNINAYLEGYREKTLSIPIVIMGEPSSLAPVRETTEEFQTL
jgi:hypothetical protein